MKELLIVSYHEEPGRCLTDAQCIQLFYTYLNRKNYLLIPCFYELAWYLCVY